jgi:hypothetical protein
VKLISDNAEIQRQAEPHAGCFETVGALRPVRAIQRFDGVQFNQQHVLHQQVREAFANQHVFVEHPRAVPVHNREARGTQLLCQYILIDLTRNPAPSVLNTVNARPITCPDTSFSLSPSACSACIYCLSAFKAFFVRRCRHMVAEVFTDSIAEPAAQRQ